MPLKKSLRGYYQMQAMDKIQNDELAKAEQAGLITDENYVSNDIEVELDQLILRLKAAVPNQLGALNYSPYSFVADDFYLEAESGSEHRKFFQHVQSSLD